MKQIKMLATENVATSVGPKSFFEGAEYTVEDWIAATLLGRGLAQECGKEVKVEELDLEGLNVAELKTLARQAGIKGYNSMKKDQLIEALSPVRPPKEPFEAYDLTGGVTPPEFKRG